MTPVPERSFSGGGEQLVLLHGLPRSGTTVLSLCLGAHPRVLAPPEPWFLLKLKRLVESANDTEPHDDELATRAARELIDDETHRRAARDFATAVYARLLAAAPGKTLIVDKTPRYHLILDWLDAVFPSARRIWLLRDPLDVAASYRDHWGIAPSQLRGSAPPWAALDFSRGLFALDRYFGEASPTNKIVRYERLAAAPQETLRDLFGFLGLDDCPAAWEYGRNTELVDRHRGSRFGDPAAAVERAVHARALGRWPDRLTDSEVRDVIALTGIEILERLGYGETAARVRALGDMPSEGAAAAERERLAGDLLDAGRKSRSQAAMELAAATVQAELQDVARERLETIERLEVRLARAEYAAARLARPISARIRSGLVSRLLPLLAPPCLGVLRQHSPKPLRPPASPNANRLEAHPRIAIVTPSLNQHRYLEQTVRSVLDQSYPALDYSVSDGASSDGTGEFLATLPHSVRRVSAPDGGQTEAINRGFAGCDAEIMAWLNADDLLLPGALERVAATFAAHPGVDVVYGHRVLIDENGLEIGRWMLPSGGENLLPWADYIPQETIFWRRRLWDAVGGLDEAFDFALDWDLLLRFRAVGARFFRMPSFVAAFRVHAEQKTSRLMETVGQEEMRRLRHRCHGRAVSEMEVADAVRGYTQRAALLLRLHRLGLDPLVDWLRPGFDDGGEPYPAEREGMPRPG